MKGDHEGFAEAPSSALVEEGAPLWTVTFGDMMSLLLTFFILLFSMSEVRIDQFRMMSQSMSAALGGAASAPVLEPTSMVPDSTGRMFEEQALQGEEQQLAAPEAGAGGMPPSVSDALARDYLSRIAERLDAFVAENDLGRTLSVSRDSAGVRLRVLSSAFFGSALATVDEESMWILEFLAELTHEVQVPVTISGHADDRPIRNDYFASNWELSAARAAGVARELVRQGHDPLLIRVESHGEHRPIASNDSPDGRALNRRIEFLYEHRDIVETVERWHAELRNRVARPDTS